MTERMRKRFLDCSGMTLREAESYAHGLCEQQRDVMFQIGDLYRYCKARWPDTHFQVWPEWVSPGMLARAGGVTQAYPHEEDRQAEATYTIYMRESQHPERLQRVEAHVEAGRTSDEARKANQEHREGSPRWLLAVDCNYFLHRFWYSGAGVEAAVGVATWVERTVERLKEKGLTDVACCFDSYRNDRKKLTEDWEDRYKDRPKKDPELGQQLQLVRELLTEKGYACVSVDGEEADDVMASYAEKFPGHVTLLTQDKDVRQCLSDKCNMLLDVEWIEDDTSGDMLPEYKWLSAKQHTESTGIRPDQWVDFQAIMGDNVDGIKGAIGIGEKGAADLVTEFGSVEAAIEAAKADDERIKQKKREALIDFESKLEVTKQLVGLHTNLDVPLETRV